MGCLNGYKHPMKVDLDDYLKSNGYTLGFENRLRKKTFKERLAEIPKSELEAAVASSKTYNMLCNRLGLRQLVSGPERDYLIAALDYHGIDRSGLSHRKNNREKDRTYIGKNMTAQQVIDAFFLEKDQHSYSWPTVTRLVNEHKLLPMQCMECGISPKWNGLSLTLEIDHVNGDNKDHRLENLRRVCPNCHSQTVTYKGRNIKSLSITEIMDSLGFDKPYSNEG